MTNFCIRSKVFPQNNGNVKTETALDLHVPIDKFTAISKMIVEIRQMKKVATKQIAPRTSSSVGMDNVLLRSGNVTWRKTVR